MIRKEMLNCIASSASELSLQVFNLLHTFDRKSDKVLSDILLVAMKQLDLVEDYCYRISNAY